VSQPFPGTNRRVVSWIGWWSRVHSPGTLRLALGSAIRHGMNDPPTSARHSGLIDAEAPVISTGRYRSSNGDCWRLISDPVSGRRLARRGPNPLIRWQVTETPIEEFLAVNGPGPAHDALRQILGSSSEEVDRVDLPSLPNNGNQPDHSAGSLPRECWIPVPIAAPVATAPNILRHFLSQKKPNCRRLLRVRLGGS
jgi:hypothetical protein